MSAIAPISCFKKIKQAVSSVIEGVLKKIIALVVQKRIFNISADRFATWGARFVSRILALPPCVRFGAGLPSFNLAQYQASVKVLQKFGANPELVTTKDQAKVTCYTMTSADFFRKIDEMGGERQEREVKGKKFPVIAMKSGCCQEQYNSLLAHLESFGFYIKTVNGERFAILPPCRALPSREEPLMLRCTAPLRTVHHDRVWIAHHLASGCSVCFWEPRGNEANDEHFSPPSEVGYYLDAEAVFTHAQSKFCTSLQNIWASGHCMGAGVVAYLKVAHPQINFVAENMSHSLRALVENKYGKKYIADGVISSICAQNASVEEHLVDSRQKPVQGNGFDTEAWLLRLEGIEEGGKCVFVWTESDQAVPSDSRERLEKAARKAHCTFHSLIRHDGIGGVDHHPESPILSDQKVYASYMDVVFS